MAGAECRNSGTKVEQIIEINRPPEVLYRFWRNLEQLRASYGTWNPSARWAKTARTGWSGSRGQTVEWDARIINDEMGKLIA